MSPRFVAAVAAASLAQVAVFVRVGDWFGPAGALALGYLMLAAAGAGYFSGTRPALAGFLSVVGGALAYALLSFGGAAGADVAALIGWVSRLLVAVLPYAAGGAVAGWLGGRLRARVTG